MQLTGANHSVSVSRVTAARHGREQAFVVVAKTLNHPTGVLHIFRLCAGLGLTFALIPSLAAGQGAGLARIDDVRGLETRGSCFALQPRTADPQALRRIRYDRTERSWPRDSVIANNERVVVGRLTDVRLRADGSFGGGSVYLAPELGRCPGSDLGRHLTGRTSSLGTGSYEFKKDTVGRGANAKERLVVIVRNGGAVVHWRSGQVMVRALSEQIQDLGSQFTVVVDSAANRGIVTVQTGLVTMRGGSVRAGPGESFTFGEGQQVQSAVVRSAGLEEIRFHASDVWGNAGSSLSWVPRPPVPSLPWKKIIGGSLGVSAVGYTAYRFWPKKGPPPPPPVQAFIVITIPL